MPRLLRYGWAAAAVFGCSAAAAQTADLAAVLTSSTSGSLSVGQEVVVSATVRNDGPNPATGVLAQVSAPPSGTEPFLFQVVAVDSGSCAIDSLDIEPPRFNYYWTYATIPAGASDTCAVRLRILAAPASGSASLTFSVNSNTADPAPANNIASALFGFALPAAGVVTIPALNSVVLVLLTLFLILSALSPLQRNRIQ